MRLDNTLSTVKISVSFDITVIDKQQSKLSHCLT